MRELEMDCQTQSGSGRSSVRWFLEVAILGFGIAGAGAAVVVTTGKYLRELKVDAGFENMKLKRAEEVEQVGQVEQVEKVVRAATEIAAPTGLGLPEQEPQ